MPTWTDVDALAARLSDAERGQAADGSAAWYAGRHVFVRYREVGGRPVVQVWSGDMDLPRQLAHRGETFVRIDTFDFRVSAWALLERLDTRELAELMLDSYAIRGGVRRAERVDEAAFFGPLDTP